MLGEFYNMEKMNNMHRQQQGKRQRQDGYTLVELMIVVAIICILAIIAFPQFARYRRDSNAATVTSDARNAFMASAVLLADNSVISTMTRVDLENAGFTPSTGVDTNVILYGSVENYVISSVGAAEWGLSNSTTTINNYGKFLNKATP